MKLNISNKDLIIIYNKYNYEHFQNAMPEYPENYLTEEYQISKIWHEFDLALQDEAVRFYVFKNDDLKLKKIVADVAVFQIEKCCCQISYKTDKDHTGQGFAREAVAALAEYVFADLKIDRIEACVLQSNIPSVKVAESCGFTHIAGEERILQINGREQTHLIFKIDNPNHL